MKKIFPVITVLVFLSLIGLIFFQYLWIRQMFNDKVHQFEEHLSIITQTAGNDLVEQKGNLSPFDSKKNDDVLSTLSGSPLTITHKFSRDEIRAKIKNAFQIHGLKDTHFEFAVTPTSMIGEQVESDNFAKEYQDTLKNKFIVYPLSSPSGSISEGVSPEELLVVVIPDFKQNVWKQMSWTIIGSIMFTILIFIAFFVTLKALLKQKKAERDKVGFHQ